MDSLQIGNEDVGQDEAMRHIEGGYCPVVSIVARILLRRHICGEHIQGVRHVVNGLGIRVGRGERVPVRESAVEIHLQGVVIGICRRTNHAHAIEPRIDAIAPG